MHRSKSLFFIIFLICGWVHIAMAGDGGLPSGSNFSECSLSFKLDIDVQVFKQIKELQKTVNALLDSNNDFKPGILKAALRKKPSGTTKYQIFYEEWEKFYNTRIEIGKLVKQIKNPQPEQRAFSNEDYIMLVLSHYILSLEPNLSFGFFYNFDAKIVRVSDRIKFIRQKINEMLEENGNFKSEVLHLALQKEPDKTAPKIFTKHLNTFHVFINEFTKYIDEEKLKLKSKEMLRPKYYDVSNNNYALLVLSNKILSIYPILLGKFYYHQIVES